MVNPSHKRAGRLLGLFSPAAHRRGQMALQGFEYADYDGPALPLALYELGQDNPHRGGGPAAPLALRLFVEAVLAEPYDQRNAGQPVALQVTLRELLDRLYPGPLVTPTLGAWGAKSAPAYSALLNLAYRWFDPGVTRHPVRGGHWLQAQDPERYPALSDTDVVAITRPLSARAAKRNLAVEGWQTLRQLEEAGELEDAGGTLPPASTEPQPRRPSTGKT